MNNNLKIIIDFIVLAILYAAVFFKKGSQKVNLSCL